MMPSESSKALIRYDHNPCNLPPNMCRQAELHDHQNIPLGRDPNASAINLHLANVGIRQREFMHNMNPAAMNMHFAAQTKEEEKIAREAKAVAMQQRRMLLSDEQKKRIRDSNAEAMRLRRSAQTDGEKHMARAAKAAAMQLQRSLLNEEQRQRIREANAAAMRIRRSTLSEDEKQLIRDANAAAMRIRRASQSEEERQMARKANAAAMRLRRSYLSMGKKPPCNNGKSAERFDLREDNKHDLHFPQLVGHMQVPHVKEEIRYGEHILDADYRSYRNAFCNEQKPELDADALGKHARRGKRRPQIRTPTPKVMHTPSFLHDQTRTLYENSILSLCQSNGFGFKPSEHRGATNIPHNVLMYH